MEINNKHIGVDLAKGKDKTFFDIIDTKTNKIVCRKSNMRKCYEALDRLNAINK